MKKIIYIALAFSLFATSKAFAIPPGCRHNYYHINNLYCTGAQISNGICDADDATHYERDSETGVIMVYDGEDVVGYYSSQANLFAGTQMTENELITAGIIENPTSTPTSDEPTVPKTKRLYYTPTEAAAHVNHSNNNKIIFTFK